jgi:hypothetical protein
VKGVVLMVERRIGDNNPGMAPGIDNAEELEQDASKSETAQSDYTKVTADEYNVSGEEIIEKTPPPV